MATTTTATATVTTTKPRVEDEEEGVRGSNIITPVIFQLLQSSSTSRGSDREHGKLEAQPRRQAMSMSAWAWRVARLRQHIRGAVTDPIVCRSPSMCIRITLEAYAMVTDAVLDFTVAGGVVRVRSALWR